MNKIIDYIKNNYNFYILIGLTLAFHFVSSEAFLVGTAILAIFYIGLDLVLNKHLPLNKKYIMIIPLIIYLCVGIIFGLKGDYEKHNIIRDIFYHTNTLAVILLALSMFTDKMKKEQVFWTILIVGTIMGLHSLYIIKKFVDEGNELTMNNIRYKLENTGYIVNYIGAFSFLFIKKFKYITIPLSIFNLVMALMSFSRVLIVLFGLIVICMVLYYLIFTKYKLITIGVVLIGLVAYYFVSKTDLYNDFIDKIFRTLDEINPDHDWTEKTNAWKYWRGYEVYLIVDNFNNSSILNKIFGNGFGSFIYTEYGIYYQAELINELAIFHNGYFGSLFKCGILGLSLYISFIGLLYFYSFKYIKDKKDLFLNLALITYIVLATYVVMGLFHKEVWFILVFLIIYLIKYNSDKKIII